MNDFTKEELELIEWYVRKEKIIPDTPYFHLKLLIKLQSLIDNYPTHCEHSGVKLDNHKYHLQQQSDELREVEE